MTLKLTSDQVWQVIEKELFAVLGMVTGKGESRTVGIIYAVRGRKIYIASAADTWKVRHIAANPNVSLTIPIAKRVPIMPWIKIPQATITLSGTARIIPAAESPDDIVLELLRGLNKEMLAGMSLIEVTPEGEFVTYGVGVPLMKMRDPEQARGRAPVG
jgi:general stress protein 26